MSDEEPEDAERIIPVFHGFSEIQTMKADESDENLLLDAILLVFFNTRSVESEDDDQFELSSDEEEEEADEPEEQNSMIREDFDFDDEGSVGLKVTNMLNSKQDST